MNTAANLFHPSPGSERIAQAVQALEPYMVDTLRRFVAAASPSGAEQPASQVMEDELTALGLQPERIVLDTRRLAHLPLFSPPCCADGGRYNLLAVHGEAREGGRSVLFNGHVDVVPTGPERLWRHPPFQPWIEDGWLHGRGSGDMKGGIVCALVAFRALQSLGLQPAGRVGFNWVLEEESTGNGTLASVAALRSAIAKDRLASFDAVLIPEPLGEQFTSAQVGVFWMTVELTGRPAHAAYMSSGLNPIEAGVELVKDLKALEAEWNQPGHRHPAFEGVAQPINFNLGRIEGGEWNSSVPCTCTLGIRIGFYPDMGVDEAKRIVEQRLQATVARLGHGLQLNIRYEGFHAPGCVFDLDGPAMDALAAAHRQVHGTDVRREPTTATTDARHFHLMLQTPVTCYGPLARHIHGIDEAVSLASMRRVATVFALFMADWCGVEPLAAPER